MSALNSTEPRNAHRKPIAACISSIFALAAPTAYATTFVTNCNDAGVGSLRTAVASAPDGDTIDATGLSGVCSTITLKTGAIVAGQNNLTIKGPGVGSLTVTAKYSNGMTTHQYQNRIFTHNGTGTLSLQDMTTSKGYQVSAAGNAFGGCIYSKGSVSLNNVNVTFCQARTTSGSAVGGGIYTKGGLTMLYSNLSGNTANGGTSGGSIAGGANVGTSMTAKYSSLVVNSATNSAGTAGLIGAAFTHGNTFIRNTTISGNSSGDNVGGLAVVASTGQVTLLNSTISGNTSQNGIVGGIYAFAPAIKVYNSTLAFNTAASGSAGSPPGAQLLVSGASPAIVLESSILANNTYGAGAVDNDLSAAGATISGHNNLIRASTASLPADTIVGRCPLLKPLKSNGGLTQTHSLYGHSPAIDVGNNTFGSGFDQRGSMTANGVRDFARVSGPAADIGALEVDQTDEIYDSSFEGCP